MSHSSLLFRCPCLSSSYFVNFFVPVMVPLMFLSHVRCAVYISLLHHDITHPPPHQHLIHLFSRFLLFIFTSYMPSYQIMQHSMPYLQIRATTVTLLPTNPRRCTPLSRSSPNLFTTRLSAFSSHGLNLILMYSLSFLHVSNYSVKATKRTTSLYRTTSSATFADYPVSP